MAVRMGAEGPLEYTAMPRTPMPPRPPFIPVPGTMQAEMLFTYLGQIVENVYHVQQGDGATAPTVAQMNALATALKDWEAGTGRFRRSVSCSLRHIIVRDLTTRDAPAIDFVTGLPLDGNDATQALPGNVTVAVKWSTAFRGRSFRGRTYHVGMTAGMVLGDQLVVGLSATLAGVYNGLLAAVNAVPGCTLGVVSYAHLNAWRAAGLFTPITAASVDNDLDSQRRRLAGRGT